MHRLKKAWSFSFKITKKKVDKECDMGGGKLLTVRWRSQKETDKRKIKWRIFPDRLSSHLYFIYV